VILLTQVRRNGHVDLVIVLDEQGIERIKQYDPAEIPWSELPPDISLRGPATIAVAFCTAAEQKEIERMSLSDPDWKTKAIEMVSRGFKFRPEAGDHDFGPTMLGQRTKWVKQ
jgi:hypothetical protein